MISPLQFAKAEGNPYVFNPKYWLPKNLAPDLTVDSLEEISTNHLRDQGIRALAIDYDGVVAPYHSTKPPAAGKLEKLNELSSAFRVCILSNRKYGLLDSLRTALPNIPVIGADKLKPSPDGYLKAVRQLDASPQSTALVEDRLITGVSGGNNVGMYTIWIHPPELEGEEPRNVKLYRSLEEQALRLMDRAGALQQDKHAIRNNDELLVDVHFHLGRQESVSESIDRIAQALDVVAITDRGDRFRNPFEYTYEDLISQAAEEGLEVNYLGTRAARIRTKGETLYVVKAQEIFTAEGYDIVIIGNEKTYKDDTLYESLLGTDAISLLSTPCLVPNSIRIRSIDEATTIASAVDCIEGHNQNLFPGLNQRGRKLAQTVRKPDIAVSDNHKYRVSPVVASGIVTPRSDIQDDKTLIETLKNNIIAGNYKNHEAWSIPSALEILSLRPAEIKRLFKGRRF